MSCNFRDLKGIALLGVFVWSFNATSQDAKHLYIISTLFPKYENKSYVSTYILTSMSHSGCTQFHSRYTQK